MKACFMPGSFLISSRLALTALPPKTGHFSEHRMEHSRRVDIHAECWLARNDFQVIHARQGLADDLEILRILENDVRREAASSLPLLPATRKSRSVWTPRASRRRHAVVSSVTGTFQLSAAAASIISPARRADLAHRRVVSRNRRASAFDLAAVLRIQIGLQDFNLVPIDIEFIRDDLRQRITDSLSCFRILRDDRERIVGINRDVRLRRVAAGPVRRRVALRKSRRSVHVRSSLHHRQER